MDAMSLVAAFSDLNEECFDDVYEEVEQSNTLEEHEELSLNSWYEKTICSYGSSKVSKKSVLSEHEVKFVQSHTLISAVDVTYCLLAKYTVKTHEEQIAIVLQVLEYLGKCRLPKEILGGFLILMIKYHFLP